MKRNHLLLFASLLCTLLVAHPTYAQHPVIFETFTNSCDLCPAPNDFDQLFKQTLTAKGSMIIHLNHHVANVCDEMAQFSGNSSATDLRLANLSAAPYPVFIGAVDRQVFSSTGTRESPDRTEWESQIDADANKPAPASITLVNATIDKTFSQYSTFHADVDVTSLTTVSDSLHIYFALLEDGFNYAQCNGTGPSVHNDVVRFITVGDSVVPLKGMPAGTVAHMQYTQKITAKDVNIHLAKMRLIAFIEESSNGNDYHIVNAAQLKTDIDTLQAPPQVLALQDTSLDGKTFTPGSVVPITFHMSNVLAVMVSYSIDNGANWRNIANTASSPFNWTVPDSATTQAKIKLTGIPGNVPISIEKGTFTIAAAARSLKLLSPKAKDTVNYGKPMTIKWTMRGIDSVMVLFSGDFGVHWDTIARKVVNDSSFTWVVNAAPTVQALVSVVPLGVSDVARQTSDAFTVISTNAVAAPSERPQLAITSAYPNPIRSSDPLHVRFTVDHPSAVQLQVLDLLGREVMKSSFVATAANSEVSLPTATLHSGYYILRLTDGEKAAALRIQIVR